MNISIIQKKDLIPQEWSQGNTYEYFIYPNDCAYSNKDFLFRISSASITSEPAVFTNFDNYKRYLLMLDNSIDLEINNKRSVYQKHSLIEFTSNDLVTSNSTGNDFNLMLNNSVTDYKIFLSDEAQLFNSKFIFVFALSNCTIDIDETSYSLSENNLVCLSNNDLLEILITPNSNSIFITL